MPCSNAFQWKKMFFRIFCWKCCRSKAPSTSLVFHWFFLTFPVPLSLGISLIYLCNWISICSAFSATYYSYIYFHFSFLRYRWRNDFQFYNRNLLSKFVSLIILQQRWWGYLEMQLCLSLISLLTSAAGLSCLFWISFLKVCMSAKNKSFSRRGRVAKDRKALLMVMFIGCLPNCSGKM